MPRTTDYLPTREVELFRWSNTFTGLITQGTGEDYGLSSAQTASFALLNTAWSEAFVRANGNMTRTPASITAKDDARDAMVKQARELARIIQANPDVTAEQRRSLGLTVRDTVATPIAAPREAPGIHIESATGTYVKIRLRDRANPNNKRGKPKHTAGAAILTAFGRFAPDVSDDEAWMWRGNYSRTINTLNFPGARSGETLWITACWFNSKCECGPRAQPLSVQIPGQLSTSTQYELRYTGEDDRRRAAAA